MQWDARPSSPRQHNMELAISKTRNHETPQPPRTRPAIPGVGMSPLGHSGGVILERFIFSEKECQRKSVSNDYDITEKLGMGAFGVVKKGKHRGTSQLVAIKCIRKADCKPSELRSEVSFLRMVRGYPGIVSLEEVYETTDNVNIVMEFISGGELFDAILENYFYSEQDAADLVRQLVTIVDYCHGKNIVHRDLKPENLLFQSKQSQVLKLIDFGIAALLPEDGQLFEVVGSRTYMAPEIDRRCGYGKPVDMYSVGVIMYILLCGYPPFDFDQGIYELAFGSPEWDEISITAKSIIRNLLQDDPPKRHTAEEMKQLPWVIGREAPQRTLTNNIHATIKNYVALTKMRTKAAGERGHNRRMSIYGLFNISREKHPNASPVQHSLLHNISPIHELDPLQEDVEAEMIKSLKNHLWEHLKGFQKIKDSIVQLKNTTKNTQLKEQLIAVIDEIDFLTNEYKTLLDSTTPKLRQALIALSTQYGQKPKQT